MTKPVIATLRRLKQPAVLAALLLLAACANGEPLPEASGPWHQLNVGYWQASPADLNPQVANHGH